MKGIELIAMGDELLSGARQNTNGVWLAKILSQNGFVPDWITIVSDNEERMKEALLLAEKRAKLVVGTGGLGPTLDDGTEKVARSLFGEPKLLPNRHGSASGLFFERPSCQLFFLPGPPSEMQPLFEESVLPILQRERNGALSFFSERILFFLLPEVKIDPILRELQQKHKALQCGIYPSIGLVEVRLTLYAEKEAGAKAILEDALQALKAPFPGKWAQCKEPSLEEAIANRLVASKKTLALAESVTGGALACYFTRKAGASQFFKGSAVVYANEAKSALLGVDSELIYQKGAVSEEVARQMAQGALERFQCDYALAATGIAGPSGGTPEKPVGTLYFGLATKEGLTKTWHFLHPLAFRMSREQLIEGACNFLLGKLWNIINEEI